MDALAKIGIDLWSVLLYLINTGILVGVLTYLLYKPALKFLDERRHSIQSSLDEADELKRAFEAKTAEMHLAEKEMRASFEKELADGRAFVEEMKAKMTAEMQEQKQQMMEKAMADIQAEKERLMASVRSDVLATMEKALTSILLNRVPEDVITSSVSEEWDRFTTSQNMS